jgi:hypothetical protein
MVLFACEQIPAMGAPSASVDLLYETHEIAAVAQTIASSIWSIFAWSPWRIPPCSAVPMADLPRSYENNCGCSHSRDLLTGKEDHGKAQIFNIYERKRFFFQK